MSFVALTISSIDGDELDARPYRNSITPSIAAMAIPRTTTAVLRA
jgi:hypothetical protein